VKTPSTGSVLVLTALDLEYQAIRKHLTGLKLSHKEGTLFECGQLPGSGDITGSPHWNGCCIRVITRGDDRLLRSVAVARPARGG
jgi:hypothetical protein